MDKTYTLNTISEVASILIANATSGIFLFYGEMGVGKTTLIKEIALQLGVTEAITSPTFSIVNEYLGNKKTIYHFDFYRIVDETEALDIGIEDYFNREAWIFIEWPDKIKKYLPKNANSINLTTNSDGSRKIKIAPMN